MSAAASRRVLILAPMKMEQRPIVRAFSASPATRDGIDLFEAVLGDQEVLVTMIGVGPAAAAAATERALDALGVDHVLVCGIAGGLGKDLEIGSVVMPARVVDLATDDGFDAAPLGPMELARTIGTTHELILDPGRLDGLRAKGIDALDMETAAVARVCANRGIPWSAVRSISDRPQDGLLDDSVMEMLNTDGTANAKKAVRILLTHPWKIAKMARLGRDSSLAANRAAKAALKACTG